MYIILECQKSERKKLFIPHIIKRPETCCIHAKKKIKKMGGHISLLYFIIVD
jgi:hypothetical protein